MRSKEISTSSKVAGFVIQWRKVAHLRMAPSGELGRCWYIASQSLEGVVLFNSSNWPRDIRSGQQIGPSSAVHAPESSTTGSTRGAVDFANLKIHVNHQVYKGVETTPKGGQKREVPMSR